MTRHAIVAGASAGIGAAVATELRSRGWRVSGLSRRPPPDGAVDAAFACDVTEGAALARALDDAGARLGPPDALVWCVGEPAMGRTLDVPATAARKAFDAGFWAMEAAVRRVVPEMTARGRGAILAVLSLAALRAVPYEAYYAASKAAAERWLECLALELEPLGVRVQCVYPGYIATGFLERGGWWGMPRAPAVRGSGIEPADVGRVAADMLDDRRRRVVLGWRERAIVLADRVLPGAYDWALRRRSR